MKTRYPLLPSWVMDWTNLEIQQTVDNREHWSTVQTYPRHPDSLKVLPPHRLRFEGNYLVLRGYKLDMIDVIANVNSSWSPGPYTDRHMQAVYSWRKLVLARHFPNDPYRLPQGYSTCHNWATMWFKTLCQGRRMGPITESLGLYNLSDEEVETVLRDSIFDLSNIFILDHDPQYMENPTPAKAAACLTKMTRPELYMQTLSIAGTSLHEKRMFFTSDGYMGIADHQIRQGDLVYVSDRCGRPLILRPLYNPNSNFGRQTYTVVSMCYMEGIMSGPTESTYVEYEEFWIE